MIRKMVLSALLILVSACSDPKITIRDTQEINLQLKIQNQFLRPIQLTHESTNKSTNIKNILPFSASYLEKRHDMYLSLQQIELTDAQQSLADYLSISERFPARFFPWPANISVVDNMLASDKVSEDIIADWVDFNTAQLKVALQSKLKLNPIELDALTQQLAQLNKRADLSTDLSAALKRFSGFLSNYNPRRSIGLYGLPNGSSWYQSKLNYFAAKTDAPMNWLLKIIDKLSTTEKVAVDLHFSDDHQHSVLEQWLNSKHVKIHSGFDWAQDYKNLPIMAKQSQVNLTMQDKAFWLTMMETDLGIHYQAWKRQQAKVNLQKRLQLTSQQADYLVDDIVFYPAFSFSYALLLTNGAED